MGAIMGRAESFQDRIIRQHVAGLSFVDVGGRWGTRNEKVSVANLAGARSVTMADMQPPTSPLWQDFRDRCAGLGVSGFAEISINLDDPHLHDKLGTYEFVHSSGIIYHAPSPLFSIAQLRTITERYLLIGSMVVPERIANGAVKLDFAGVMMLLLPAIDANRSAIMAQHFEENGLKIAPINADQPQPFRIGGMPNYSPWWWLYSATTLRAMMEVS